MCFFFRKINLIVTRQEFCVEKQIIGICRFFRVTEYEPEVETNTKFKMVAQHGWGSKFGTTKCRTADISKIRNFEY